MGERDHFLDFLFDFEFLFLPLDFPAGVQVPGSVWLDLVTKIVRLHFSSSLELELDSDEDSDDDFSVSVQFCT